MLSLDDSVGRETHSVPPVSSLAVHEGLDDTAQCPHLLLARTQPREHGAEVLHHGGALFRRVEETTVVEFLLQVREEAEQLRLIGQFEATTVDAGGPRRLVVGDPAERRVRLRASSIRSRAAAPPARG